MQKIESGEIRSFDVFLRILRTLGMLDELTRLCEEEQMSPNEYFEMVNSVKRTEERELLEL